MWRSPADAQPGIFGGILALMIRDSIVRSAGKPRRRYGHSSPVRRWPAVGNTNWIMMLDVPLIHFDRPLSTHSPSDRTGAG